jgi:hypothetical protein
MNPRKITKFVFCERHAPMFAGVYRYRCAEVCMEGGWANGGPCQGGKCRLWPGTDFYFPEICNGEYPLEWTNPTRERVRA